MRTTGAPALRRVHVRPATAADADALADLAARTFHLACPPTLGAEAIEAFVTEQLGADRFAASLADPERLVHVAEEELAPGLTRLVGYTLVVLGAAPPAGAPLEHPAELSKCYVLPEHQGSGVAGRLLAAATAAAREHGARTLWLGTNRANRRAQRFYARHGFVRAGSRRFTVGGEEQDDVVMTGDVAPT
ncbi:GNAT family N-acetyltransferase [Georgenia faecalis]|uniref:GNAT family N-acetyltransferase n=1 Tax=Georgenia faecalis TaxID=2483799 RepID=A0ABV9DCV3_9MICO|nr:GNAT family N-acetyltransferase [Georgenia faecalis]